MADVGAKSSLHAFMQDRTMTKYVIYATVACAIIVYYPILSFMVYNWKTNPDYSHGFLIAPLAIYFAYERGYDLRRAELGGSWWGLLLLTAGVLSLMIGELGALLTALRSGFVLTLMGLVLLLGGKQIFRVLFFPMAFLFLMVPLPQSLVNVIAFPLQLIAAEWAVWSLQLIGIPTLLEGNIIHLAHTELFVAEACSGLRSLMALLTLGVVFAYFFRPGHIIQQVIIVASTIPIAILVNAVRVAITGFLTHYYGHDAAGGFIHEFQGMITFSMAFFLLLLEARILARMTGIQDPPTGAAKT